MRQKKPVQRLHLPHNSLHVPAGQVPHFGSGSEQERMQRAIAMEMQAITREIYVRAASALISRCDLEADCAHPLPDEFESLAVASQKAARAFFTGLGVIEETEQEVTSD